MHANNAGNWSWWLNWNGTTLSWTSKALLVYGALMWLACGLTYLFSLGDDRTLREVGICAYFSDRRRLFQADRGRRFGAIMDGHGRARVTL